MSDLYPLPYTFARKFSLLARRDLAHDDAMQQTELFISSETAPAAISEASRRFGRVKLKAIPHRELTSAIDKAYAGGGGNAAQVIDEYESDLDLARQARQAGWARAGRGRRSGRTTSFPTSAPTPRRAPPSRA